MTTTYVVVKLNTLDSTYDVGISTQHHGKFKIFEAQVPRVEFEAKTNLEIVTSAWTLVKDDISTWIDRIDTGDDFVGRMFTPQDDGTLEFLP
jgi:hypothetical protein